MVCRCRDGTYGPQCCSQGGRSSRKGKSKTSPATQPRYLGTAAATSRKLGKFGKTLQQIGLAQISNSYLSNPRSSGKIWTPLNRREARIHAPDMLKNSKKYDWRPKGESINWETKNSPTFDPGTKRLRGREAHWARRPIYNQGIYSQPTTSEIYYHRKSQRRKGQFKFGSGTGMRLLGKGLMFVSIATYAFWLYEDPSLETLGEIAYDFSGAPLVMEHAKDVQTTSMVTPFF